MVAVGERKALVAPKKPVVFVRCNPDGRVVDGVKERVRREARDAQLLRVLGDDEPAYAEQICACVVFTV
jgi:hypothetical protein